MALVFRVGFAVDACAVSPARAFPLSVDANERQNPQPRSRIFFSVAACIAVGHGRFRPRSTGQPGRMSEEDKDQPPDDRSQEADSDYGAKVARKPFDGKPIAKTSSGDADKMVEDE